MVWRVRPHRAAPRNPDNPGGDGLKRVKRVRHRTMIVMARSGNAGSFD